METEENRAFPSARVPTYQSPDFLLKGFYSWVHEILADSDHVPKTKQDIRRIKRCGSGEKTYRSVPI